MRNKTVKPDGLADALTAAISQYSDDLIKNMPDAVKEAAKETAKELITDVFENAQMLAVDTEEADNNTELYAYMEEELFKKLYSGNKRK